MHATCSTQCILLDLITLTVVGEVYKSWSFLLCHFLHLPLFPLS